MKLLIVFCVKKQLASLLCKLFYLTCVVNSILLLSLLHFTPTGVASLKIRKRLILNKLLPLSAPFQHFRFLFQPLSSKCFRFHKKLTASTAFSFHFHIPGVKTRLSSHILCHFKRHGSQTCKGERGFVEKFFSIQNDSVLFTIMTKQRLLSWFHHFSAFDCLE